MLDSRGLLEHVERLSLPFGVTVEDLASRDRTAEVRRVRARIYAFLTSQGLSSTEVGRMFGRDHSTILKTMGDRAGSVPTAARPVCSACGVAVQWKAPSGRSRFFALGSCECGQGTWVLEIRRVACPTQCQDDGDVQVPIDLSGAAALRDELHRSVGAAIDGVLQRQAGEQGDAKDERDDRD